MKLISMEKLLEDIQSGLLKTAKRNGANNEAQRLVLEMFAEVVQRQKVIIDTSAAHNFIADAERLPAKEMGETLTWLNETLLATIRERDALRAELEKAKADLKQYGSCEACAHHDEDVDICPQCDFENECFEWRGLEKEDIEK